MSEWGLQNLVFWQLEKLPRRKRNVSEFLIYLPYAHQYEKNIALEIYHLFHRTPHYYYVLVMISCRSRSPEVKFFQIWWENEKKKITVADLLSSSIIRIYFDSFYEGNSAKIQHVRPYAPTHERCSAVLPLTVYRLRYNSTPDSQFVRERVDQI